MRWPYSAGSPLLRHDSVHRLQAVRRSREAVRRGRDSQHATYDSLGLHANGPASLGTGWWSLARCRAAPPQHPPHASAISVLQQAPSFASPVEGCFVIKSTARPRWDEPHRLGQVRQLDNGRRLCQQLRDVPRFGGRSRDPNTLLLGIGGHLTPPASASNASNHS